ncbi:MAG: DUF3656 domain-containing protein, partial [Pelosinus sp.]|nr:DUF3656 domain-containing protein [Pelosinus sp.]
EYVAVVVDTYRRMMDACLAGNYALNSQDNKDLAQIFNRDFTTAYLKGKEGRYMMSDRRPNNRGVRIGRVTRYDAANKMVTIKLDEDLAQGDIVDFWVKVGGRVNSTVNSLVVDGKIVTSAEAGTEVTFAVSQHVRVNDRVFKVFDARLMQRARAFFTGGAAVRRVPVSIKVTVAEGKPLIIKMQDNEGFSAEAATNFIAEKAVKRPLTEETIKKQMDRLGTTIFEMAELKCTIAGEVMVPVSEMNDARRRAVEGLEVARLSRFKRPLGESVSVRELLPKKSVIKAKIPQLMVNVDSLEKVEAALKAGADVILFGGETFQHRAIADDEYRRVAELVHSKSKKVIFNTPRLIKEWQIASFRKSLALFQELRPDGVSIANLGTISLAKELIDLPLYGDYSLNVYNSVAVDFFAQQGFAGITLSPELTLGQVAEIAGHSQLELTCLVHGYLTLMISEYCVLGSFLGDLHTGRCKEACSGGTYWLKDRKEELFPVVTDQFCRMHILNAKELSMLPHAEKFGAMGISSIRIEGKYSSVSDVAKLTRIYQKLIQGATDVTEAERLALEHENITRGHYFRGVL